MYAQTWDVYAVEGIVMIVLRFCQGQALPDFGETGQGIVILLLGLE